MNNQLTVKEISSLLENPIENKEIITGISYNSKEVKEGDIFICLIGEKADGHNFIKEVESKGARAVIVQKAAESNLPIIKVKDTQIALAKISNLFYGEPTKKLRVIGITGTNGKTTTTHLIQHILEKEDLKTAVIGTLGTRESSTSNYYDAKHTTPQAPELQKQFSNLLSKDFSHIAMEVSSHALSLHRVDECNFAGAVFTNLTQDHLDFHLSMEAYFQAKKKLFEMINISKWENKYAIINADDERFNDLTNSIDKNKVKLFSYGIKNKCDFLAKNIIFSTSGVEFDLQSHSREHKVKSKLNGLFNVYNILAAIATAYAEKVDINKIVSSLSTANEIPGRFQIIHSEKNPESPICIVDYAHTPDGLENILKAARLMVKESKKLICVFGCGGDRDPTKRPKMGKIAEDLSDSVIVTSDNPRSEDPKQIITDILSGIKNTSRITVEADRKSAIEIAIKKSSKEDVIVIAGKGHEDYQILKDKTIHFDDREEVKLALEKIKC